MLRSEIVAPVHSHTLRLIFTALGCGAIGAGIAWFAQPAQTVADVPAPPPITEETLLPVPMPVVVTLETPAPSREMEVNLVFRAAGST